MAKTISNLKDDIAAAIHGTSIDKIQNIDGLIYRAAGDLLLEVDPIETKRTQQITNALYDQVYDYVIPTDLKGKKVIDIKPQINRNAADSLVQRYSKEFDQYKSDNTFSIKSNSGVKTIRISKSVTGNITVNSVDSLTANGTWAASGVGTNLTLDTVYNITGDASLNIDASSAGNVILENSTMTQVDLSDHDEQSGLFVWAYMPDTSLVTNVTLRWGNDSSNYWSRTVTQSHDATAFQTGWNLLRFDWNGATETGTVVPTIIDYLRVTIAVTGADTDYRIDNIMSILPVLYEIEYYSKYLFRNVSGTWIETISADTDYINLDTESYQLLFNRVMILLAPQLQGSDASLDLQFYSNSYKEGVKRYTEQYKSEWQKPSSIYYSFPFQRRR